MYGEFHAEIGYPLPEGRIDDIWMSKREGHNDTDMRTSDLKFLRKLFRSDLSYYNTTGSSISRVLSTICTPGADHAAFSASSFSANERTLPRNITFLPETSVLILDESIVALR